MGSGWGKDGDGVGMEKGIGEGLGWGRDWDGIGIGMGMG